jgi:hypothetical protein
VQVCDACKPAECQRVTRLRLLKPPEDPAPGPKDKQGVESEPASFRREKKRESLSLIEREGALNNTVQTGYRLTEPKRIGAQKSQRGKDTIQTSKTTNAGCIFTH